MWIISRITFFVIHIFHFTNTKISQDCIKIYNNHRIVSDQFWIFFVYKVHDNCRVTKFIFHSKFKFILHSILKINCIVFIRSCLWLKKGLLNIQGHLIFRIKPFHSFWNKYTLWKLFHNYCLEVSFFSLYFLSPKTMCFTHLLL